MKKLIAVFVLLSFLLTLSACDNQSTGDPTSPTESDTQPIIATDPVPTVPVFLENLYSVSMPVTTQHSTLDDGTRVFSYSYQTMYLISPERDAAERIKLDFVKRINMTQSTAEELSQKALSANASSANFVPYSYQVHYNPVRLDAGVLSLYGQINQSGSDAHVARQAVSANYDMVTGDVLTLGSILYHIDSKAQLVQLVVDALSNMHDTVLYDDYAVSVETRFSSDESTDEAFFFNNNGLCFYFSPYEIGPYSSGTIVAEIPYEKLTGVLGDAFFPVEQIYSQGTVSAHPFDSSELDQYNQFAELIVSPSSNKYLLNTDSFVQNISIRSHHSFEDIPGYTEEKVIFLSSALTKNDAILIEADLTETQTKYILSYQSNGASKSFRLSCNDDGSLSLIPV